MPVATAVRLKPLGDRVLVKAVEKKDEIRSGIIIPETAKEKPQEGEIIAVGKGKIGDDGKLIPMDVKAGDKIKIFIAPNRDAASGERAASTVPLVSRSRRLTSAINSPGNFVRSQPRSDGWPSGRVANRDANGGWRIALS